MVDPEFLTKDQILSHFERFELNQEERYYLESQAERLAYIIRLVQHYTTHDKLIRPLMLDVGSHFLTRCMLDLVDPRPTVSIAGFHYDSITPSNLLASSIQLDLNTCGLPSAPSFDQGTRFDIITCCEIVEHLFVPPNVVFSFLAKWLKPGSGKLIVGTPNAVSYSKRLAMMQGRNPFEPLHQDYLSGRGHIREYTIGELKEYGAQAGLEPIFEEFNDYWDQHHFPDDAEISRVERENQDFRAGLTIVFTH
jgi:SAM-dependent methyltransferase